MIRLSSAILLSGALFASPAFGLDLPLSSLEGLKAHGVELSVVDYEGSKAVRMVEVEQASGDAVAVVEGIELENGVIEVELAGKPRADARPGMRGFIGLAFRLQEGTPYQYECIYLRPTNGRAEEQIRRNHTTQYVAHPDFPWYRQRKEAPGVYESYVDLEPGVWTKMRIEVEGEKARLFVHDASQPTLVINDLKHGESSGAIALWIGEGTEAYFKNLIVTPSGDGE